MTHTAPYFETAEVEYIEIRVEQRPWEFATSKRAAIDAHFTRLQQERPLWNGRAFLLHSYNIRERNLRGTCFETDYASLTAWLHWDIPDRSVYKFFAAAALRAADGAYLVGEMAAHTSAAGQLYFPCGTPEPADILDGHTVDLQANLSRELREETGIAISDLDAATTWRLVLVRNVIALIKEVTASQNAIELRSRIIGNLASDPHPEFSDIHILRGPSDLDGRLPHWMTGYLGAVWKDNWRR